MECKTSFLNPSIKAPLLISFEFAAAQTLLGVLIVVYNKPELSVQVMIKKRKETKGDDQLIKNNFLLFHDGNQMKTKFWVKVLQTMFYIIERKTGKD